MHIFNSEMMTYPWFQQDRALFPDVIFPGTYMFHQNDVVKVRWSDRCACAGWVRREQIPTLHSIRCC